MSTKRHVCRAAEERGQWPEGDALLGTSSQVCVGTSRILPLGNSSLCLTCCAGVVL